MKKILYLFVFIFAFHLLYSQTVNGELRVLDNKLILKVWGTHYQRGYAQGYLLANNIKEIWSNYIFSLVFFSSSYYYNQAVNYVSQNFIFEDKYHEEAQGIIDGMNQVLNDLYMPQIGREINKNDIFLCNSLVDYISISSKDLKKWGCSSLSCWGNSTNNCSLQGNIMITRFLDWQSNPSLMNNPLLMVQFPAEENEVPWFSVGFPGLFGALSAMNINNVSAFMNMGNINEQNQLQNLHSIWLSIRNAIENYDYNFDGFNNNQDVFEAINDKNHSGPFIVHSIDQNEGYIIETNNESGCQYRTDEDNTIIPDDILVATNHFRKLYTPVFCNRYQAISDSVNENPNLTIQRCWEIMSGAAGTSLNLQAMQYIPSENIFKWSTASTSLAAYQNELSIFDINELFSYNPQSSDNVQILTNYFTIYPNPASTYLIINYNEKSNSKNLKYYLYNLKGEILHSGILSDRKNFKLNLNYIDKKTNYLKSGLYFIKIVDNNKAAIKKFIIIK